VFAEESVPVAEVSPLRTALTCDASVAVPLICGPMYPCSNPGLVAAVSEAGGLGVVQPLALTNVHGYDLRDGLRLIRHMTAKPIGMNLLIDRKSRSHHEWVNRCVGVAIEEGVRFFIASCGDASRVVRSVADGGGRLYQNVETLDAARRAADSGVHGLVCVNVRAGGQVGRASAEQLVQDCGGLGLPLVCAGGIGDSNAFAGALRLGYAGALAGTRFIATTECTVQDEYKRAIVEACEHDIVHTERVFGAPLAVIATPFVRQVGTTIGPIGRLLFKGRRTSRWVRAFYAWRARGVASVRGMTAAGEYWQAGKSVAAIHSVQPAAVIMRQFAAAAAEAAREGEGALTA
jgi:nitronate monooxygenase